MSSLLHSGSKMVPGENSFTLGNSLRRGITDLTDEETWAEAQGDVMS